jgi:hypothetical protein
MTDDGAADHRPRVVVRGLPARFRKHLGQGRTADLCDTSCRGLLSGLRRKCIEPVAPEAETAVRTFQEFLGTAHWHHPSARDTLRAHLGGMVASLPADPLGIVGVIDETNCRQWATTRRACNARTWGVSARSRTAS